VLLDGNQALVAAIGLTHRLSAEAHIASASSRLVLTRIRALPATS
jgi:hypothetical protein